MKLVGVLNVTPDSFSDGGNFLGVSEAANHATYLVQSGAALVEVGAESTRPGSQAVPATEQLRRLGDLIPLLRDKEIPFSIDTSEPEVAEFAVRYGVSMINDVRGFSSQDLIKVARDSECRICIMHMQGDPSNMQKAPQYADVVAEVVDFLSERFARLVESGIHADRIVVDPGIGFGKSTSHNLQLLKSLNRLVQRFPSVMVGVSRKGFLGKVLGSEDAPVEISRRIPAAIPILVRAAEFGVSYYRTHDVQVAKDALTVHVALR